MLEVFIVRLTKAYEGREVAYYNLPRADSHAKMDDEVIMILKWPLAD